MEAVATQVGMPLDEFIRLYDTEGPFEIINGERKPKMPNVAGHGDIVDILYQAILLFTSNPPIGKIIRELPFVLSYTTNWVTGSRIPDLMYFRAERLNTYKETHPDWKLKPYILIPDLVVEVVSPTDNLSELLRKIDQYLMDGIKMAWVIDPQREMVSVFTLTAQQPFTKQEIQLTNEDVLTGGTVIPGFEIPISRLWQ